MKRSIILLSLAVSVPAFLYGDIICSNKSAYDIFSQFMKEQFGFAWTGRGDISGLGSNEKIIAIFTIGSSLNEDILRRACGLTRNDLENILRDRELFYRTSADGNLLLITASDLNKLGYYLNTKEDLRNSIISFINPKKETFPDFKTAVEKLDTP